MNITVKEAEPLVQLNEGNLNLTSFSSSVAMESGFQPSQKLIRSSEGIKDVLQK